jgi:hypothetical protein
MSGRHSGGCLCGAVRYRVDGPLRPVVACHCRECRRQSGHYYAATQAPARAVEIEDAGTLTWYRSSAEAERGFCGRCGAALFFRVEERDVLSILAGSLDAPTGLRLAGHIFTGEKGGYYPLDDGLPQLTGGADGDPAAVLSGTPEGEG